MGISYYRLKQTDFDGKYSYSDIKKISFNSDNKIVLFPNIFNNQFTIEGNNIESREINIFNLIGQDVKHFTKQTKTSDSQIVIDAINLSTGFYYVKVDNNTFKVYKQ